jgi:hypothetical protein
MKQMSMSTVPFNTGSDVQCPFGVFDFHGLKLLYFLGLFAQSPRIALKKVRNEFRVGI